MLTLVFMLILMGVLLVVLPFLLIPLLVLCGIVGVLAALANHAVITLVCFVILWLLFRKSSAMTNCGFSIKFRK